MSAPLPKICHLNIAPGFRGGERQTELLLGELAKRGYQQRLVVKRGNQLATRCAAFPGVEIREIAANPLAAGLAVKGCQIAHSHEGRTVYSALLANLLFGVPYLITRRVVAAQSKSFFRSLAYRRASQMVAVSRAAAAELKKKQPNIATQVIADAAAGFEIDQSAVARIRSKYVGKTLIGHIGALEHSHKGQSTIIEAARLAADAHPDWHFLLCGDGGDRGRFEREIGALNNIELLGWVENVGDHLASFDIFIYPSLHEALGSTLLDAMQVGLPIIASQVGGIPDIVEEGVNGRLIRPEQPSELFAALAALLGSAETRSAMGSASLAKVAAYSASAMAAVYCDTYNAISTSSQG